MALHTTSFSSDVLDAKRQLARDNEWLWKVTVSLRESNEIIQKPRCSSTASRKLLHRLDRESRLHDRLWPVVGGTAGGNYHRGSVAADDVVKCVDRLRLPDPSLEDFIRGGDHPA